MKIACISTARIPSDTANSIQVMKACQALARLGHTVDLFVPQWEAQAEPGWDALAERYGLRTHFAMHWLETRASLKRNDFAWLAVQQAQKMGAERVYTWAGQAAVFALLAGLPTAYEVHDLPAGRLGPVWFWTFRWLAGKKRLLPITQALLQKLEARFGVFPKEQVVIAPNGVDLEQYADLPQPPEARRELNLPEATTVLCAGHLYAGRGVELFLSLARQFPQASFVWAGGRAEDVALSQAQAQAEGLSNVTFTGFISQRRLPCYQAAADILLMPYARSIAGSSGGNSADICSPMKMFDYLAAGRAILSSDLPVIHEVLSPSNARFASPEDLPAWTEALRQLLENTSQRQELAAQARQSAQLYSWLAREQRALEGF